jgi:NDP-sugar pyrophosphorylase family protein
MQAVILTGGKGTRLAPYTTVLPKPLMPIGEIPILEIILRQLKYFGFSEVILACGYLAELIQAYLANNKISQELNIRYHRENQPLGTAGAIASLDGLEDTFLVMNGDILTALDYSKLVRYHRDHNAAITIAVTNKKVKIDLGVLHLDDNNQLTGYSEKPVKEFPVSTGIYIYDSRVLKLIEPDTYLDFPTLVLKLIDSGEKVMGYSTDAFWLDMGNKDDYEAAIEAFNERASSFHIDK